MDGDGFWELIERSRQEVSDPQARLEWLQRQLAQQPTAEIVDFQVWLDRVRRRADTWDMWGAAYLICDSLCSGDGFWYFQVWLIGLGRDAFERAVANPHNLASLPEVLRLAGRPVDDWSHDDWPHWESLSYVAWEAYEQVTGENEGLYDAMEAQGHHSPTDPDPTGQSWDFEDPAEAAQRLPRLSWMFPLTDRATRDQRGREAFARLAERGQTEEAFIAEFLGRGADSQEPRDRARPDQIPSWNSVSTTTPGRGRPHAQTRSRPSSRVLWTHHR